MCEASNRYQLFITFKIYQKERIKISNDTYNSQTISCFATSANRGKTTSFYYQLKKNWLQQAEKLIQLAASLN